ncbi:MAG: antibiotic biosynthesis monooxygenase [Trueperaceae bacterium]|nr:antibiotic biosynthesis monooxygenase [Trueperaceae bacterium]
MFGLIGKIRAREGRAEELAEVLTSGTGAMPGCTAYLVARDVADPDVLWVTEVWEDKESHAASLRLPSVQAAIARGRPLIAGFELHVETSPYGRE